MRTNNFAYKITSFKYNTIDFLYKNKVKIYICAFCLILGMFTGIFTAIKMYNSEVTELFEAFNITDSIEKIEALNENFFARMLSYEIVLFLLFIFSQSQFISTFGYCLITYRMFLVSINCVVLVIVYTFGGILKSLLIIFPCQILMLIILCLYFCYNNYTTCHRKKYKIIKITDCIYPFVIASLLLTLLNIIESLLLFVFKSNVILVI